MATKARRTIEGLKYIASSPPRENGGFHPEAVKTAKAALRLIARMRRALREVLPALQRAAQEGGGSGYYQHAADVALAAIAWASAEPKER